MNNRQMEYFVRIAELGSFRRASESLRIAQPALTRHIKNLEADLGVELFNRRSDGVVLTSAGGLLLERARVILRQTQQARADVMAHGTVPSGSVGFGAPPSIAQMLFGPLAAAYQSSYPQVLLRFQDGVGHLFDWLVNEEIDLAILPSSRLTETRSFCRKPLVSEPVYVVGAPGRLPLGRECGVADVTALPLVLTPAPSTVRSWLDELVRADGHTLQVVAETESSQVQKDLVRAGLGFAVLPHSAVHRDHEAGLVDLCQVRHWRLSRVLAWRNDRPLTPAVREMIRMTEALVQELFEDGAFGPAEAVPAPLGRLVG